MHPQQQFTFFRTLQLPFLDLEIIEVLPGKNRNFH